MKLFSKLLGNNDHRRYSFYFLVSFADYKDFLETNTVRIVSNDRKFTRSGVSSELVKQFKRYES